MTHTLTLSFFYGPVNSRASRTFQFVTVEIALSRQMQAVSKPASHAMLLRLPRKSLLLKDLV